MASCSDNGVSSRFLSLQENDRSKIRESRNKANTKNATKLWKNLLNQYLIEKDIAASIEHVTDADLPKVLEKFYSEIRTKKTHERYKNSSLRAIRAGVNRFIKDSRGIDIISDPKFMRTNDLFKGVTKENKEAGKGNVQHKVPISSEDLERLQDYFSLYMAPNPTILQRCVLFNLMFFLCRRGRENLTGMTKDTFDVSTFETLFGACRTVIRINFYSQSITVKKKYL